MTNTLDDKFSSIDKELKALRKEVSDDLLVYGTSHWTIPEKCSCGKRDRVKCVEESGLESGKMCLRGDE